MCKALVPAENLRCKSLSDEFEKLPMVQRWLPFQKIIFAAISMLDERKPGEHPKFGDHDIQEHDIFSKFSLLMKALSAVLDN